MRLNRGEWSEIYAIFSLLTEPDLKLYDSNFNLVRNDAYRLCMIAVQESSNHRIEFRLGEDGEVAIFVNGKKSSSMQRRELFRKRDKILKSIIGAKSGEGAFEIADIDNFLKTFNQGKVIKASSYQKGDIDAVLFDKNLNKNVSLSYSIKSSLGMPATILNSSNKTNFIYKITNFDSKLIEKVNSICTKSKLLDRIKFIADNGGIISYHGMQDKIFEYNLSMIDSNMPKYLGEVLLLSYMQNQKNLKTLFINSKMFSDESEAVKKLGDLLKGISFGFFPSIKWDGKDTVTGGIVNINKQGQICVLDRIYFDTEVTNYLINETKLDSPSSSRYHMLELFTDNNEIFFTLNLQLRYTK